MTRIAVLVDRMFEDSEFRFPYDRLRAAGYDVDIVGLDAGSEVEGKLHEERVTIEKSVRDVSVKHYDALVIPGGDSPDYLRVDADAVRFTRDMAEANKPVAAVCHALWMLIEADLVDDRIVTSGASLRKDLVNAGALCIDRDVVVDGNVITSRRPDDLAAFTEAILHQLEDGVPLRAEPALVASAARANRYGASTT